MKQDAVFKYLRDGKWRTASEIHKATGVRPVELRKIANETVQLVSGQRGYRLIECATLDEIDHNIASLRSRSRKINDRADALLSIKWRRIAQG